MTAHRAASVSGAFPQNLFMLGNLSDIILLGFCDNYELCVYECGYSRPGGSKIVLVGPSCRSRVLRGGEAAGYGRGVVIGGGGGRGCPPPARSAEDRV